MLRTPNHLVAIFFFWLVALPAVVNAQKTGHLNLVEEPLQPLPAAQPLDPDKVALGRDLFFDKRLSKDDTKSCASCHDFSKGGADGKALSEGVGGAEGNINTPTVFNSVFNFAQFWDGRSDDLTSQMTGPINNPVELGASWNGVIQKLRKDASYTARFAKIYDAPISQESIQDAIATFEKSLITPNSRFDLYLAGEASALTLQEKNGYTLFKAFGCSACHQGRNIGGNMFQKFGVLNDYFAERGFVEKSDYGRFNVTGREEDRFVFKVPSLRNVALTAPYFHDASVDNLEAAVEVMAYYQLGRRISDSDRNDIVSFLKTLTGEFQGKPLWQP